VKSIQDARKYAAQINHECANHALDDDFGFASHVTHNDKLAYAEKQRSYAVAIENGEHDSNFTIMQRMDYFLTGEMKPLLK